MYIALFFWIPFWPHYAKYRGGTRQRDLFSSIPRTRSACAPSGISNTIEFQNLIIHHPQYHPTHLLQFEPALCRQKLILRSLCVRVDNREHREPIFLCEGPLHRLLFLLPEFELAIEALNGCLWIVHLAFQRDLELLPLLTKSRLHFVQDSWEV